MVPGAEVIEALPVPVYMTDAEGRITAYNTAAVELWGCRPDERDSRWCGSWRLFFPDGRPMAHEETPVAVALREGRAIRAAEILAERPDGTRVPLAAYPSPLRDASGQIVGAINLLVSMADQAKAEAASQQLAAIVAGSDDAIISKSLDGIVMSWNAGATRIFGYQPEEMIGQPIIRIIPPELHQEEAEILAKLRRGERIDHFDTKRIAKDGRRLDISLTVSPLRDRSGRIVGASKIARDITDRKRAEELQALLFGELNHRVKNMLATIQAIASQSLRRAATAADFVTSFNGRVQALARAHDLLVQSHMKGAEIGQIVREQVLIGAVGDPRVHCAGPSVLFDTRAAVHLALVLHELATNARKYGALSVPNGRVAINWRVETHEPGEFLLEWKESGVPNVSAPTAHGFGTTLIERTLQSSGGQARILYEMGGITCRLSLPLSEIQPADRVAVATGKSARSPFPVPHDPSDLSGKRVLVVEDEPLVALETEAELRAAGCIVVGPAGTLAGALRLLAEGQFDAALVDANLGGQPVDELAAALVKQGIPFAFATGYGKESLPRAFREMAALVKPFTREQLLATVTALVHRSAASPNVIPLKQSHP